MSRTDPLGETTKYSYDNLNETTSITDALNGRTLFGYDGNGNLTTVTDANGHTTSYTYDNMDRLATRTDPLNRTESYQYDGDGNLAQFTDRRGEVTTYTYDNLNRQTFAGFNTQPGPTYDSTISYTYDAGNRLTQAVDSITGTITRAYDGLDRLTSETTPQGSVSYGYDAANRRTSMSVSNQAQVAYSYDNANRLTQITQGTSTVSFAYDNANRRTSLTLPNGVTMSYSYDNASELTGINYTLGQNSLGNLTYAYDLAGRRTSMGGSLAAVNLPNAISTTAYDAANEVTQWGTATPTYDANGNTLSDGTNSYVWDARNHLASMDSGADTFEYGPFGRRVAKTTILGTTNYLYDGSNPAQELSGTTPTANMLTGLGIDEYFQRTDSSGTANFLTDALGSTVELTNSSGGTVASYTYEPFGNTTATGTSTNPYQYTGRENDGTGLYFLRARYYSPTLQRFVSEDPMGFRSDETNLYGYAADGPSVYSDPSGLDTQVGVNLGGTLFGGLTGIGGGLTLGISTNGTLSGTSLFASGEVTGMVGVGAYAGGGLGPVFSHTTGSIPTGLSTSTSTTVEADGGWGPSGSVNASVDDSNGNLSLSFSPPISVPGVRGGGGYGGALSLGETGSLTANSPTLGQMARDIGNQMARAIGKMFGRK